MPGRGCSRGDIGRPEVTHPSGPSPTPACSSCISGHYQDNAEPARVPLLPPITARHPAPPPGYSHRPPINGISPPVPDPAFLACQPFRPAIRSSACSPAQPPSAPRCSPHLPSCSIAAGPWSSQPPHVMSRIKPVPSACRLLCSAAGPTPISRPNAGPASRHSLLIAVSAHLPGRPDQPPQCRSRMAPLPSACRSGPLLPVLGRLSRPR